MSEIPPPERRPEPLAFDPQRDQRANAKANAARSGESPGAPPQTRDPQRELIGQTVGGRYRIKGILGEGGMGTVYDAEHLGLSRQVAIKVLSPSQAKKRVAVKRFQQEARAAGAIGHPNICEVYDLGLLDDGSPYLVMEKLVGQTLAERIAKEGGLPFDEVVEVIVQVLSGLIAAHEKGIVHRDIKPENIFLARRLGCPPIIKLLDFGVSKMMAEFQTSEDHLDLTRTGMVMGTPYYMSPEQARGERNLDGRVDVYACGVVMYEAIVGKRPFLAPNYNALLLAIINTTPKPLREVRPKTPPELEAIIAKAMEKNRNDRFITAKEFLRQLAPPIPSAEGSGSRLPAPPTAEERKRALVLGGGHRPDKREGTAPSPVSAAAPSARSGESRHGGRHRTDPLPPPPPSVRPPPYEPLDSPDGPSATLRSRMAESEQRRQQQQQHDRATRLDVKMNVPPPYDLRRPPNPPAPSNRASESDDSIDIPIHVTAVGEEEEEVEEPTEIFRPGMHPHPASRAGGQRSAPASVRSRGGPASTRGGIASAHGKGAPPSVRRIPVQAQEKQQQPVSSDDWEGETIVKRPDHAPPSQPPQLVARPAAGRRQRPFNPDETMKLENNGEGGVVDPRVLPRRPQR